MISKSFCWQTSTKMLVRIPFHKTKLEMIHWLWLNGCVLPFPFFLWCPGSMFPLPLKSDFKSHSSTGIGIVCASAYLLLCYNLDISFHPANVVQYFQHPSSFCNKRSHHITVLVCPLLVSLPSQQGSNRVKPYSFAQFLTLVFGRSLLPTSRPILFQKHFLHIPRVNESHVQPTLGPTVATRCPSHESRKKQLLQVLSHVSTSEPQRSAFSKPLSAPWAISPSKFLLPRLTWPLWTVIPPPRGHSPPRTMEATPTPFSPLLPPSASSILAFLQATKPILNSFLTPITKKCFVEDPIFLDEGASHIALFPSRLLFRSQLRSTPSFSTVARS